MTRLLKLATLGVLLGCAAVSTVQAHHSAAMYDPAKVGTLTGTVKTFSWVNPHISIEVVVADATDNKLILWTIGAPSPGVMTRSGWSKNTLKTGDRVTIEFNPLRDGQKGGLLKKAVLQNGKVLGWTM